MNWTCSEGQGIRGQIRRQAGLPVIHGGQVLQRITAGPRYFEGRHLQVILRCFRYCLLGLIVLMSTPDRGLSQNTDEEVLVLINDINIRTGNAIVNAGGIQQAKFARMDPDALLVAYLLKEYGFKQGSLIWKGDVLLLFKARNFTAECATQNLFKAKRGRVSRSMELVNKQRAVELFRNSFSSLEIAAIQYELKAIKTESVDQKRKDGLAAAGYDTNEVVGTFNALL